MNCTTGSFSRSFPSSTSFITLVVVATTFVNEARSKIVSSVIGSGAGAMARFPNTPEYTTASPRPTRITAPGSWRALIASPTTSAIAPNRDAAAPWSASSATLTAENPNASPSSLTAITDDKGRFSIIGMRSGQWTFTATMQGFQPEVGKMPVQTIGTPNPPITFTLKKGGGTTGGGALAGVNAKELQGELGAADQLYNAGQYDQALAAYKAV